MKFILIMFSVVFLAFAVVYVLSVAALNFISWLAEHLDECQNDNEWWNE